MNPANEIIIDEQTGQTLAKLARHKDDARAFVKAADVEPESFEEFLHETGQMGHPAARDVWAAASERSAYRLSVSQLLDNKLSPAGDVVLRPFRRETHRIKTQQEAEQIILAARLNPGFEQANMFPEADGEFTVVLIFRDGE